MSRLPAGCGKNAAPAAPGGPATPEPARASAVPGNPQPEKKAVASVLIERTEHGGRETRSGSCRFDGRSQSRQCAGEMTPLHHE
jgi:hypothetical protein